MKARAFRLAVLCMRSGLLYEGGHAFIEIGLQQRRTRSLGQEHNERACVRQSQSTSRQVLWPQGVSISAS